MSLVIAIKDEVVTTICSSSKFFFILSLDFTADSYNIIVHQSYITITLTFLKV